MREIVLSAPGKNALSSALMNQIRDSLTAAAGEPVLIRGEGDAFSAGLNLKELAELDEGGMERFLRTLEAMVSELFTYPGPTVAAVNGHAIAGGCVVALCCDHRVASREGRLRMGLNEVALGLQFPPGILRMIRMRLSPSQVNEACLGAALHDPASSLRLGFLDELAEDPVATARVRLEALARHPREAYAATKRTLRGEATTGPQDAPLIRALLPTWCSPAVKERILGALKGR